MHVISRRAIREFAEKRPHAETSLDAWYRIAKQAKWSNIVDTRKDFPHADAVGRCTVFNVHGNEYRLIAEINYRFQTICIVGIYSHQEYSRGRGKSGW